MDEQQTGTTISPSDTSPSSVDEETQEIHPDEPLDEVDLQVPVEVPEGEGGNGGEKYDGGEIPPAASGTEPVE